MASRRERAGGRRVISARDVVSGAVEPTAAELIRLVHEANPTGERLSKAEALRRYAEKAKLQSVLIRRFGDDLIVERGRDDAVIGLRHRHLDEDACHAVVAELDDDVRGWVVRQLDLGSDDNNETASTRSKHRQNQRKEARRDESFDEDASPDELFRRGVEAQENFDFESARGLYETVLAEAPSHTRAAGALVALLVDTLAADADALEFAGRLAPTVARDSKIKVLLAVAAARLGNEDVVERSLLGVDDARGADACTELARQALRANRLDSARTWIERAQKLDSVHPDLAALQAEFAQSRANARAPLEAEIKRAEAEGRAADALERAKDVLRSWPESAIAREIVRAHERSQREAEFLRLVDAAEEAWTRGDWDIARATFQRASWLPGCSEEERHRLGARGEAAKAKLREEADAATVARVVRLFEEPTKDDAYRSFLALEAPLRTRVRAAHDDAMLGELEAFASHRDEFAIDHLVRAIVAFVAAKAKAETDPSGALAALVPHRELLRVNREMRVLDEVLRRRIAEQKTSDARERLCNARRALDDRRADEARGLVAQVVERDLPDGELAALATLRERLQELDELDSLLGRYHSSRIDGDALSARNLAVKIGSRVPVEQKERWERLRATLNESVRSSFRIEVIEIPGDGVEVRDFQAVTVSAQAEVWLTADTRTLVLVDAADDWVFVRLVDRVSSRCSKRVSFRAPIPLQMTTHRVDGEMLTITGANAQVLRLSLKAWDIEAWLEGFRFVGAEERFEGLEIVGNGQFAWIRSERGRQELTRVVDVDTSRVVRELSSVWHAERVRMKGRDWVVCLRGDGATLREPRGGAAQLSLDAIRQPLVFTEHPKHDGLLVVTRVGDAFEGASQLAWAEVSPTGAVSLPAILAQSDADQALSVATSKSAAVGWLVYRRSDEGNTLTALASRDDRLEQLYRVKCPGRMLLVRDEAETIVAALLTRDDALSVRELGREPPDELVEARAFELPAYVKTPSLLSPLCRTIGEGEQRSFEWWDRLRQHPRVVFDETLRRCEVKAEQGPRELVEIAFALGHIGQHELQRDAVDATERLFGAEKNIRLLRPEVLLASGDSEGAWSLLEALSEATLPPARRQHFRHLRAAAALVRGDAETAAQEIELGKAEKTGKCELDGLSLLVDMALGRAKPSDGEENSIVELWATIVEADILLDRGDFAAVRTLFDRSLTWRVKEVQSLARLAFAHLAEETFSPWARFDKRFALAMFREAHAEAHSSMRRELVLSRAGWSRLKLDEVAARAGTWLNENMLETSTGTPIS